ncbi:MAG: hypothetical protein DDT20_00502 [Firmicutes bacterium]|nr:hypothetical protein [Bacillota bacterium]
MFHTARMVYLGDMCQTPDNRIYEVTAINGFRAEARLLRTEAIAEQSAWFAAFMEQFGRADVASSRISDSAEPPLVRAAEREVRVAVYHTHSAESYRPSDGASSIRANGGILRVGDAFAATAAGMHVGLLPILSRPSAHEICPYQTLTKGHHTS